MLKVTFKPTTEKSPNPYRNRTSGKLGFIYTVSGSEAEIAEYKTLKGDFYREDKDTKVPMHFEKEFIGVEAPLIKNQDGTNFFANTGEQDIFAALCKKGGLEYANNEMAKLKKAE